MRLLPNLSQAGGVLKTLSQMLSFKLVPLVLRPSKSNQCSNQYCLNKPNDDNQKSMN